MTLHAGKLIFHVSLDDGLTPGTFSLGSIPKIIPSSIIPRTAKAVHYGPSEDTAFPFDGDLKKDRWRLNEDRHSRLAILGQYRLNTRGRPGIMFHTLSNRPEAEIQYLFCMQLTM